jgi:hypothetical protein
MGITSPPFPARAWLHTHTLGAGCAAANLAASMPSPRAIGQRLALPPLIGWELIVDDAIARRHPAVCVGIVVPE